MARMKPNLDVDEILALAVRAMQQGADQKALGYLERILEQDPDHGSAHHLLGSLHASTGRFDLAIEEMSRAVELEADPAPARFELGMMHLTSGRIAEAEAAWKPLDDLGDAHPLFLFKRGMLRLVKNEFERCVADLERGISLNETNPALNTEMRKVVERARQAMTS